MDQAKERMLENMEKNKKGPVTDKDQLERIQRRE